MLVRKAQSAAQAMAKPLTLQQKREEDIFKKCFIKLYSLKMFFFLAKNTWDDELFCKIVNGL